MKKYLSIAIALLFSGTLLFAQTFEAEKLFQKYKGEEGIVALWIPGIAMKLAASIADLDGPEADLLKSVKSIRILTIEDGDLYPHVNFTREANIQPGENGFYLLMQINDSGEDIMILAKEKRDKLRDLLIIVGGDDNVMVHIKGRMNADMIGSIADIAGIDQLSIISQL